MGPTGEDKKVWYLRRLDIFLSLTDEEIDKIARVLDDRLVPAGAELLRDRQREQLFIVKSGAVRLYADSQQRQPTLALLGPGRLFGLSATVGRGSPTIGATTLEPSFVCFGTMPRLLQLFGQHPEVMVRLTNALVEQIFFAETWVERAIVQSPRGRLASLLLDLCDQFGEPVAGGQRIRFRLTHADLAGMIGVARETVSRLMADLHRSGLVIRNAGLLVVPDRTTLEALTLVGCQ
jgi:CRP/FNR family transcriptional regulator